MLYYTKIITLAKKMQMVNLMLLWLMTIVIITTYYILDQYTRHVTYDKPWSIAKAGLHGQRSSWCQSRQQHICKNVLQVTTEGLQMCCWLLSYGPLQARSKQKNSYWDATSYDFQSTLQFAQMRKFQDSSAPQTSPETKRRTQTETKNSHHVTCTHYNLTAKETVQCT